MPAKKFSPQLLPADHYDLTAEDKERFASELAAGMVPPNHPALRLIAEPVNPAQISSARIQKIVKDLFEAAGSQRASRKNVMAKKRRLLVGLAAPQMGVRLRICVVDTRVTAERKNPGRLECFINPQIIWRSRETEEGREGCFSAGPVWGLLRRPIAVKIRAYTPDGRHIERVYEGFTARIVQHEIDHLDGLRFADRIKNDKKRHWVHAEELALYPKLMRRWPRLCSRERWESYTGLTKKPRTE